MVGKCYKSSEGGVIKYAHSAIVTAWTPIYVAMIGVLIPIASAAANAMAAYETTGVFKFVVANNIAVSVGDRLYYDSANGVVQLTKPAAGFILGTAITAGTGNAAGTVMVEVSINEFDEQITTSVAALSDAAATLTAAQLLGGLLTITPTADRNLTLPSAVSLISAMGSAKVGTTIEFTVKNLAAETHAAKLVASSSITNGGVAGDLAVAASGTATYKIVISNVTASSEAAVLYKV